ncbi:hypothetical protein ROLI_047130 (plasmid) [Roseobacter fucihabitans]|uniref:GIY-YIG domain-containing protein n=1 Tax=Roseobacter fucihabitans TaxID=1537242 RepID=A0ABZ2C240_9RHOB|nr:hypothetical protein [Roseobacter litoralis]MBC6965953.1 hypothetical protein [Roseobacter litoralis]
MVANLGDLTDFAAEAAVTIARYEVKFVLSPDLMSKDPFCLDNLNWDSIPYGTEQIDNVPDDRRGIYAFCICQESHVLPEHCYVMYIGIAGRQSDRSLRARYRDYLNVRKLAKRSPRVRRLFGEWHTLLRFYFAPVGEEVSSDELEQLEKEINSALLPPMSKGDLEADIKQQRDAFL